MQAVSVLMPLADGVEEMEAVILADVLRRVGWRVVLARVGAAQDAGPGTAGPLAVVGSRGVRLVADAAWVAVDPAAFEILAIPGGAAGTDVLCGHAGLLQALRAHLAAGKRIAAICAGPLVLEAAGVLHGRRATCHPGVRDRLRSAVHVAESVVTDGLLTTSQGPGTAFALALELVAMLDGPQAAATLRQALVLPSA